MNTHIVTSVELLNRRIWVEIDIGGFYLERSLNSEKIKKGDAIALDDGAVSWGFEDGKAKFNDDLLY